MAGQEPFGADGDNIAGLSEEAVRNALAETRATLRDVREAVHIAARNHQKDKLRARDGFMEFMNHELRAPLSTIEADCIALRRALPEGAPDALREGIDALQLQITQLRGLIDATLAAARDNGDGPF